MRDTFRLTGVRARGNHGVFDHERADGQDFVVDVAVEVDARVSSGSDDLADTVHYGVVAEQVVAEIEGGPVDLIETLAERIASAVLTHRRRSRSRSPCTSPRRRSRCRSPTSRSRSAAPAVDRLSHEEEE